MVTAQLFVLLHALGHVSVGDVQAQAVQEAGHSQVSVGQLGDRFNERNHNYYFSTM